MVESTEKAINIEESATDLQIAEFEREPANLGGDKGAIKATPKPAPVDTTINTQPRPQVSELLASEPEAPKTDELEALWPGVHHQEFIQPIKRTPSFYIMMGFIGGAVISLVGVWGVSLVSQQVANNPNSADKPILVARADTGQSADQVPMTTKNTDPTAELVPISESYVVKSGDTLVSIALKNYRKVTPRLIDSIVEKNNLKNANVLNLGQKLSLPTYQPPGRIAAKRSGQIH